MAKVEFADFRLIQLRCLLDPKLDRPVRWKEERAIKTKFYDTYRYEVKFVDVEANTELVEKIRNHGVASILQELDELGRGAEGRGIIQSVNLNRDRF